MSVPSAILPSVHRNPERSQRSLLLCIHSVPTSTQISTILFSHQYLQKGTSILLIGYLLIINAAAFLLMLLDKRKAIKSKWRIPEATLMWSAALGGSVGALAGMYLFRHKTKHLKFTIGIPVILALQIVLAVCTAQRILCLARCSAARQFVYNWEIKIITRLSSRLAIINPESTSMPGEVTKASRHWGWV